MHNSSCTIDGMNRTIELQMVNEFQCPGCIHGTDPETCPKFELSDDRLGGKPLYFACKNWRPSTFMSGVGRICLGLEKGFNRTGRIEFGDNPFSYLRLFDNPENGPDYNKFNIPVWAMEKNGYLYVRCFCPRTCWIFVDVIKNGKMENASFKDGNISYQAINAGEFFDEMD